MLYKKFVVVPIGKTSVNVDFSFQRCYAQFFINELGLDNVHNIRSTYKKAIKPVHKIVSDNKSFLKYKLNLEVITINKNLPITYWALKLRENPTNARLIIATPNCSVKPLWKAAAAVIKADISTNLKF